MIGVNLAELIPEGLMGVLTSAGFVEKVLDDLATAAHLKWRNVAATELKTTRQTYIQSIQEPVSSPKERAIVLVGWLPVAIETGLDAFDLRTTLLGPNAKSRHESASGGFYANVPFRHGTPGTTGLAGPPMGQAHGQRSAMSRAAAGDLSGSQAAEFGKELYKMAKSLQAKREAGPKWSKPGQSGGRVQVGTTATRAGEQLSGAAALHAYRQAGGVGTGLLRGHHTTSIYTGMQKERKAYVGKTGKTTTQSQYITFRRISTENPTGWMHPGIEAHNFADQAAEHIAKITPGVIRSALRGATLGR
jgi:hypothetical protein